MFDLIWLFQVFFVTRIKLLHSSVYGSCDLSPATLCSWLRPSFKVSLNEAWLVGYEDVLLLAWIENNTCNIHVWLSYDLVGHIMGDWLCYQYASVFVSYLLPNAGHVSALPYFVSYAMNRHICQATFFIVVDTIF